jgi:hypothetical protein
MIDLFVKIEEIEQDAFSTSIARLALIEFY